MMSRLPDLVDPEDGRLSCCLLGTGRPLIALVMESTEEFGADECVAIVKVFITFS